MNRGVVIFDGIPLPIVEIFLAGGRVMVRCYGELTHSIGLDPCDYQVLGADGQVVWIGRSSLDEPAQCESGSITEVDLAVSFTVQRKMADSVSPVRVSHQFLAGGWLRRRCIHCGAGKRAHAA